MRERGEGRGEDLDPRTDRQERRQGRPPSIPTVSMGMRGERRKKGKGRKARNKGWRRSSSQSLSSFGLLLKIPLYNRVIRIFELIFHFPLLRPICRRFTQNPKISSQTFSIHSKQRK